MRRFRLSRRAKADLDGIWLRIAQQAGIEIADRFIDTITARFSILASAPEAGALRSAIEPGLRVFPVRDYLIYYRKAAQGGVLISRVIHGMRDQETAWDENE